MKKTLLAVAVFSAVVLTAATDARAQAGDGWLSRYWDGCKPSCSWSGKPSNGNGQCKECDKSNNKLNTSDANRSACDGGNSYTCWDMSPWSISATEAYGFAAAHRDNQCGTCWQLTFNGQSNGNATNASSLSGKKLTVMISNIGGDVQGNQLDFLVPGGGVGQFDAFSSQIGVQSSALGAKYGGLVSDGCQGKPDCLRQKCNNVFNGKDWLKAGCNFYADWMGAVDNPRYNAVSVTCPAALTDRWKNAATGGPPSGGTPTPTTYTLTVEKNPTAGGNTTPASSQGNINGGTQVNISATANSGYTFANWTITSGTGTIANANNASTTITVNGNVTVRANFTQNQTQYTLTINRAPTAGGSVTVSNQNNPASVTVTGGASTAISAAAADGYTFTNWTVTSGTAQINNANSASTTVSLSGNATITANFTQKPTTPTTVTLTVSRQPSNSAGTVKVNNADYSAPVSVNSGTAVNIAATAATGYRFTSWTVSAGTASIASASTATTTVTLTSNATVTANFTLLTAGGTPGGSGKDTIKVEAEDYTSNAGANMKTGTIEGGGMCIGYIENGYSATYNNVSAPQAGDYVMQFRIATGMDQSSFTVSVNGANVGTISTNNTGGWDNYVIVAINSPVKLYGGNNTVVLNFQNAVNVDYFLLIGDKPAVPEPPQPPPPPADTTKPPVISVKYNAAKANARTQVALRPAVRGFIAALPANHGFTSYKVIDLQGREVRSGSIDGSTTNLSVGNLKHSVVFLRLEGKGRTPLSMKVMTY